jgi:hypothetical protein
MSVLRWLGSVVLVTVCGCGPYVEGSAVVTAHSAGDAKFVDASAVRISALTVPPGASELGIVQAHVVQGSIEDAMPEFRAQVARLGGDFGKVTDVSTTFEMQQRTRTESYNCGSSDKPSTCTRSVTESVEVSTTRILGKAYRLGAPPVQPALAAAPEPPAASPGPAPQPALPESEPAPASVPLESPPGAPGAPVSP